MGRPEAEAEKTALTALTACLVGQPDSMKHYKPGPGMWRARLTGILGALYLDYFYCFYCFVEVNEVIGLGRVSRK